MKQERVLKIYQYNSTNFLGVIEYINSIREPLSFYISENGKGYIFSGSSLFANITDQYDKVHDKKDSLEFVNLFTKNTLKIKKIGEVVSSEKNLEELSAFIIDSHKRLNPEFYIWNYAETPKELTTFRRIHMKKLSIYQHNSTNFLGIIESLTEKSYFHIGGKYNYTYSSISDFSNLEQHYKGIHFYGNFLILEDAFNNSCIELKKIGESIIKDKISNSTEEIIETYKLNYPEEFIWMKWKN